MKSFDKTSLRKVVKGVQGEIRWMEPLSRHSTLKIGGPADVLVVPEHIEALARLVRQARKWGAPVFVLGGSNLLIRDGGIRGLVIKLSRFQHIRDIGETGIEVGGGVFLSRLARHVCERNLGGLEFALGIPGTVGGAIKMNAGTSEGEISDFLTQVRILDLKGEVQTYTRKELTFAYRSSRLPRGVILDAQMQLRPAPKALIRRRMRNLIDYRKKTQPLTLPNAGSIFKNPNGTHAAKLIEQVGLKGHRSRGAQISDRHANFIVNRDKATAKDVLGLIRLIGKRVEDRKGVTLELELRIVGRDL